MSRNSDPAILPRGLGSRKSAPRSLSCLSDLVGGATPEQRPCRPPWSSGRAPPPPPAQAGSGCDPSLRPIITRRAHSLPSSPERRQKAAGAPGAACRPDCRQHRVRFADALGLELTQVKVFNAGDDPSVPLHVLSRLDINSDLCCSRQDLEFTLQCLVPDFPPPIEGADFGERLRRQLVCLERVTCSDLGVSGSVRVRNVAFEKQVAVRYTFSDWRSALEAAARWRGPAGSEGTEDVFTFGFPVPPFLLARGSRVHFAVRYRVAGAEHWDNNDGRDYSLTCRNHELHMPRGECEESWIHFI
ncbi:protein phosphatase 1 regulatory subunit 3D [Pipistrellus kuhlii]|uniref:Protein phosphatase 1 regulatory subunit n=1 Tax=Pipistrellus kuhlii TaxID=59472 RepID=A0A7J7RT90_PIPKU|nr:protein phosphatase 1 regulatory subunit 3D [Pipistrellus kuhlii]KAF6279359.1 protein phosphatase 1 regulatory subunit 3D [Pipistrellus kuhlii]